MRRALSTAIFLSGAMLLNAACSDRSARDELMLDIHDLKQAVERLEYENKRMWQETSSKFGSAPYIVVDSTGNKLYLRKGEDVLLEAVASTGSGRKLEEKGGRKWIFNTPKGIFTVLSKELDPIWYKPDWAFVEDNLPVPSPNAPERVVKGMLGMYALDLGGGYKIHGTPYKKLLGQSVSHGCVRLGDAELDKLYRSVEVGTKVYIY